MGPKSSRRIWGRASVTISTILLAITGVSFGKPATGIIGVPPTNTSATMLRGNEGVFGAPRTGGNTHTGVDIVANRSTMDKEEYRVRAVADGRVAYAKFNGENAGEGYGYTVVIDHQNGTYTLYAHLATIASANPVHVRL